MNPIITTQGLTRKFGDKVAVDALTLEVEAGEVFGCLGHNGAGKTTTVRLLNGVLEAQSGTAQVLGFSTANDGPALRRHTGVLTETPSLDERLSARDNLRIYANLYDVPRKQVNQRVDELLTMFELADRATEKVGSYSKGMKQRLALARALVHKPDLLFLDEPTSALDPVSAKQVRDLITHNLVEAQRVCDRFGIMEHGKLLAVGTPAELAQQYGSRARLEIEVDPQHVTQTAEILRAQNLDVTVEHDRVSAGGVNRADIPKLLAALLAAGVSVYSVMPGEPSLEDIYFAIHDRNEAAV